MQVESLCGLALWPRHAWDGAKRTWIPLTSGCVKCTPTPSSDAANKHGTRHCLSPERNGLNPMPPKPTRHVRSIGCSRCCKTAILPLQLGIGLGRWSVNMGQCPSAGPSKEKPFGPSIPPSQGCQRKLGYWNSMASLPNNVFVRAWTWPTWRDTAQMVPGERLHTL